jgi:hypothetical protein
LSSTNVQQPWQDWRAIARSPVRGLLAFIGPAAVAETIAQPRVNLDWLLGLSLYAALCVTVARLLPETAAAAVPLFWNGFLLLYLPLAIRIASPSVAGAERIWLLLVLTEATFALKFLNDPSGFIQFDEFLHWETANDILTTHGLFTENTMLRVSPLYPGLEIVTTALVNLSGLSVFHAAMLVVMVCRATFMAGLFALYKQISGSERLAGVACLFYMGSSVWVMFDSQFGYETMAVALMSVVLSAAAELDAGHGPSWRLLTASIPAICVLALTHHMTSYVTVLFLCAGAALHLLSRGAGQTAPIILLACSAVAAVVGWTWFIGNPLTDYVGPLLIEGGDQLFSLLRGHGPQRQFFELSKDVVPTPLWLQIEAVASVAILALLLSGGFLSSLARAVAVPSRAGWSALLDLVRCRWRNNYLLLVSLLALSWPLTIALRLSSAGWQLGNRLACFAFIGVGIVCAISIARLWRGSRQWGAALLTGVIVAIVAVGGAVSGWGTASVRAYHVEGDSLSIEPMGVDAASWTLRWLGSGNHFVADRDNRVLLATYGRQHIIPGLLFDPGAANLFVSSRVSRQLHEEIREAHIDYLLVDMRMTTRRPYLSVFFDKGEPEEIESAPLDPEPLLKWDEEPGVSRVFDDGWIRIYDVGALQHAS